MIIYNGKSNHDGQPLMVKVSAETDNPKTGDMVQTWIMRSDIEPHTAQKTGQDVSACGSCALRPIMKLDPEIDGGGCYVKTFHGPLATFRGKNDNTEKVVKALKNGAGLRLGSYGDPAMIPLERWKALIDSADYHTGYTHQWREPYAQQYKGILMASCNNMAEVKQAKAMGWKVFATWMGIDQKSFQNEGMLAVQCPSDPTLPSHRSCAECRLCNGNRADVWIIPHGSQGKRIKG